MMGTWLPETCSATIRREIKNIKSAIQLVLLIPTELRCTVNHTSDLHLLMLLKAALILQANDEAKTRMNEVIRHELIQRRAAVEGLVP